MSRQAYMWAAVGLLALIILLIGLVVSRRRPDEAGFSASRDQSTSPALSAAARGIPVQTSALRRASPVAIESTATGIPFAPSRTLSPADTPPARPTLTISATPRATEPDSILPTLTPTRTPVGTPALTRVPTVTVTPTRTPPSAPAPTSTFLPAPTATIPPPDTPTAIPAITTTPRQTLTPRPTATPSAPGIYGMVLLDGQPADPGVILVLEDQSLNAIAETTVGIEGRYQFANVPPAGDGYNITFIWELNQAYGTDEVVAWGWIGPVAYDGQEALQLPDLEIGLLGLEHIQPEPDTILPATAISPATPLNFVWDQHPGATQYWVDILAGPALEPVWRSSFTQSTTLEFDGRLNDGSQIQPDTYWWAVGGQGTGAGYGITYYGHLAGLRLTP